MIAGVLDGLFDGVRDLAASPWFYLVIFVIALLDSVVPVVPSETTVIIGGVAAGLTPPDKSLPFVIAAGAVGAFAGDNLAYLVGRRAGPWIERRSGDKGRRRLTWAEHQLARRGGMLLVTARFVPGGRTAITTASGITRQPHGRFMLFVAIAAIVWATYAASLGFIGGTTFEDDHTTAFLVAFGAALGVTLVSELVRWRIHRRRAARAARAAQAAPADAAT